MHCDVGGGYPESDSGLSKLALEWMIAEAKLAKLFVDDAKVDMVLGHTGGYAPPDCNGKLHNSLTGFWHIAEFIPKKHYDYATKTTAWRPNLYRRRTIPARSLVHESAFLRKGDYSSCLPPDAIMVVTPKI